MTDWQALFADAAEADDGLGPYIEARFDGTCRGCGGHWAPGEAIRFDEAEGGWVGACCGGDP